MTEPAPTNEPSPGAKMAATIGLAAQTLRNNESISRSFAGLRRDMDAASHLANFVTRRMNDALYELRETVWIHGIDSAHGPGWYKAYCVVHGWETEGSEPVLEEARDEHVIRDHAEGQLIHAVHEVVKLYRAELKEKAERDAREGVFPGHDHVHRGRLAALEEALRAFAAPHSEHADYDPSWTAAT